MHALLHSVPQTLQQATTGPHLCWRLQDTPRQVWVSLLWGHCSILLDPGTHKVLFVPSKSLFPSPEESSRKTSTSALLTKPKPLSVWITTNCGKFFQRWEYQTT